MADWQKKGSLDWQKKGRLDTTGHPEHISSVLQRILRSEREIFCGRTRTGAVVRVFRVTMPSVEVALASGTFEKPPPKTDAELLDALPWAQTWHVTWRCSDGQDWPDDTNEMVATRIEQGPLRMQTWMFASDAGAAVRLCADLWGFEVKLPKEQEAN